MTWRERIGMAAVAMSASVGVAGAPVFGWLTTVPAAVAAAGASGALAAGPRVRRRLDAIAGVAGGVSLGATIAILLTGDTYAEGNVAESGWALAETGALLVLTTLVVRLAPVRQATVAAILAGVAVPAWLLRFGLGPLTAATLGGFTAWGLLALFAVAVGCYLRSLDRRRTRSVAEARHAQRLQLARDLHDFVAHDISGMLAQAQAGQIAEQDPAATVAAFRRIEQAAQLALASMDHTVRMLHDDDGHDPDVRVALPTLADLPDLAARFTASGTAVVQLDIDPEMTGTQPAVATPREVATTAYIVVREALTNVRRHAPTSSRVAVSIRRTTAGTRPGLLVTVTDDGSAPAPAPLGRRGGLGLPGLAARVQALGGTMTAGPDKPTGWRVVAVLPSTSNSG